MGSLTTLTALLGFIAPALSQSPPHPGYGGAQETSFLDHDELLSGFFGKTFLKENIPFIDIPNKEIQDVYYYRWTSTQRNLRYVIAGTGFMSTEFVQPVGYAQAYGTIVAASGHQLDESKWLRSRYYAEDYMQIYNRGPANSTQYTEWIAYVLNQRSLVTGDTTFLVNQLDDMVRAFREWDKVYDADAGLYYYQPVWDAQELSLAGFIVEPENENPQVRLDGPDTFRPSHNAYMVANARAIARAANLAGASELETEFKDIAEGLEEAMYSRLWAAEQQFFNDIIRPDNPDLTPLTGRQQVGLFPYRFGIGLEEEYAQPAIDAMFDPQGFWTEFGPTTLEVRNEWYMDDKPEDYCCYWNGQSWPYSTGHTISSLAAIYRSGVTNVTEEQFLEYLNTYARTQQKDGQPYVAESHLPHKDAWSQDGYNHSEHYAHSTYVNNVISDLFGIIPKADDTIEIHPVVPDSWTYYAIENLPYHGHLVTILYDEDGSRYNQGSGLTVFVNGEAVHRGAEKVVTVDVPAVRVLETDPLVNIAANPNNVGDYPRAEASYTYTADWPYKAIDGVLYYDDIPNNRWTNYQSPNANDTLTITFARPRLVSSVTLALYSDIGRGGETDLPARIEILGSNGLIATFDDPSTLLANDRNSFTFDEVETTFLAVNLFNKPSAYVGICELEIWQPWTAPRYFAVDAWLDLASVTFDEQSDATSNGAVVGSLEADSQILFSGVESAIAGVVVARLTYSNTGDEAVALAVRVNEQTGPSLNLAPTAGAYKSIDVEMHLGRGRNFVNLVGGSEAIRVELLDLS